jgi:hypothetical protein
LALTTSYFSTVTASTATLAAGVSGQIKTFVMFEESGNMVITVANQVGAVQALSHSMQPVKVAHYNISTPNGSVLAITVPHSPNQNSLTLK